MLETADLDGLLSDSKPLSKWETFLNLDLALEEFEEEEWKIVQNSKDKWIGEIERSVSPVLDDQAIQSKWDEVIRQECNIHNPEIIIKPDHRFAKVLKRPDIAYSAPLCKITDSCIQLSDTSSRENVFPESESGPVFTREKLCQDMVHAQNMHLGSPECENVEFSFCSKLRDWHAVLPIGISDDNMCRSRVERRAKTPCRSKSESEKDGPPSKSVHFSIFPYVHEIPGKNLTMI